MTVKTIIHLLLYVLVLALQFPVGAQQPTKVFRIGELVLFGGISPKDTGREILRRELHALGYIEGKNIIYEARTAGGKVNKFNALAEELVRLNVDVILTTSPSETAAAQRATKTIPIVFMAQSDPVTSGLVDTLARPGGNITGVTTIASGLSGKRIELLKEIIPTVSRVAVLWNPKGPGEGWKESQRAARELGISLQSMEVRKPEELDSAFKKAINAGASAIAVTQSPLTSAIHQQLIGLSTKNRIPAVFPRTEYVVNGGLISYGADRAELYRRAAIILDKILKGTKAADLPFEQPTKFELVINLKTAKQIGLTIPPNVLARADRVIK